MVIYSIQDNGDSSQMVIELVNDTIFIEPNSISYIVGNITLTSGSNALHNMLLAHFIGRRFFKPTLSGSGKIYLRPTLGCYHKFTLKADEELIIGPNAFIACCDNMNIAPLIQPSFNKFLSGTPMISTHVKGEGSIAVHMPGPVAELNLNNDKFVSYYSEVAAYSPSIKPTREMAGTGWMSIAYKMVRVYRGTGSVYFTPHPNKDYKAGTK